MFVAVFSAIKVFTWVATLYKGSLRHAAALLLRLLRAVLVWRDDRRRWQQSLDVHWHDTYFVVAHFHFIMVGGSVTGFLAAAHYWFPKMFGRLYSEFLAVIAVRLFLGFNLTFFPQFLLGNLGMPRRYYSYPPEFQGLHVLSTGGASLLGGGDLLALLNLLVALR